MTLSSQLEAAMKLAVDAHAGQTDKAGEPYFWHPFRVAMSCADPVDKIAALLHDVVEDSGYTVSDIRSQFGDEVADAVDVLTRRGGEDYDAFIRRVARNPIALRVKLADLCDNMDMSRLKVVTAKDLERLGKYQRAQDYLWEALHA